MTTLGRDLRHALRILYKSPGFSAIAVLAFALGIGANTAIFSVVNSVLLKPLGYPASERMIVIEHGGPSPIAPATFLDFKQEARSFQNLAAAQAWGGSLRTAGRPESLIGLRVSANLFSLLGVAPLHGRVFSHDEDRDGSEPVVVISYSLWQRSFGAAADTIGRRVEIDGAPYTIVGIMPASFQFAPFWITRAEIWAPLVLGERQTDRSGKTLRLFGSLKPDATVNQAQAELSAIMSRLARQYPDSSAKETVAVVPLKERVVGSIRPMLLVLLGTVGFVLLIACANVANLMLARAASRKREIAVRLALGATRWQLARQAMTDSALLAGIGAALGLLIAFAGVAMLNAVLPPGTMPRQQELRVDPAALLFTACLAIVTGLLSGLLPALNFSKGDVNDTLKQGGRSGSEGAGAHRTRSALVVCEIGLAFVLLIGAGLMLRSFARLLSLDPGFQPDNLLTMEISVSGTSQAPAGKRAVYYQEVLERITAVPGVTAAGAINHAPITGDVWGTRFRLEGKPQPQPGEWPGAVYRVAYPGYFAAMRTPVLHGRDFTTADNLQAPAVAIINEAAARRYWPGENAVGKRILMDPKLGPITIAGIVHDVKQSDWQANPREEIYLPLLQSREYLETEARHYQFISLVVRVAGDPGPMASSVRQAIESIDPNVLVSNVIAMDQAVARNLWRPRLALSLLAAFSLIAMALAVTGVYGVISHTMAQRTHEFGIRMAIGAAGKDVLLLSMRQGLLPVAIGIACGIVLSAALGRIMTTILFEVEATDPLTFGGVAAIMLSAAAFAAFGPALRAAKTDPLVALRHE